MGTRGSPGLLPLALLSAPSALLPEEGSKQGLRKEEVEGVPEDLVGSFLFASTPPEGSEGAQALTNSLPSQKEMLLSGTLRSRGRGKAGSGVPEFPAKQPN